MSLVSETCTVNGRTVEYLTAGEGDPLVFIHGGGIVEGFEPLEPLADQFRVIVPLMPGFGKTAVDPAITSTDEAAAHLVAFLDELDIEQTVLVGHSLGGWISSATAAKFADRISKLVLASAWGLDVEAHPSPPEPKTYEELLTALTNDQSVWEGRVPAGPDPEFESARELEGVSLGRLVPGPFDPELPQLLASIRQPTLILWGDDDRIVPAGHAEVWASAIPGSELRMYEGAGHLIFHERSEAVDAVAEFAAA